MYFFIVQYNKLHNTSLLFLFNIPWQLALLLSSSQLKKANRNYTFPNTARIFFLPAWKLQLPFQRSFTPISLAPTLSFYMICYARQAIYPNLFDRERLPRSYEHIVVALTLPKTVKLYRWPTVCFATDPTSAEGGRGTGRWTSEQMQKSQQQQSLPGHNIRSVYCEQRCRVEEGALTHTEGERRATVKR